MFGGARAINSEKVGKPDREIVSANSNNNRGNAKDKIWSALVLFRTCLHANEFGGEFDLFAHLKLI